MAGWNTVQSSELHIIPFAPVLGYGNIAWEIHEQQQLQSSLFSTLP